jgi:extracellular factor (EF) 3-hydroxypalmitic acid methyl ester biosynthesis protein
METTRENLVVFQCSQGVELRATLLRLSRYLIVFELYSPNSVLRLSEVLTNFKVILNQRTIYSDRAVVANLLNTGSSVICEAKLEESGFIISSFSPLQADNRLYGGFDEFLGYWQQVYRVRPEFKVIIADMQSFLMDLRIWLEQVELAIRSVPSGNRFELEHQAVVEIGQTMVPAFDAMHENLEFLSDQIEPDLRPVHQTFAKRQLHPLMLCSPFAYRTYSKPLGYAGDYEMVNMITRDPHEGSTLFAKVVNLWFLSQWPAKAHRNRIHYLRTCLSQESLRGAARGSPIRVLNLGCGPAREIQEFLAHDLLSDHANFHLLDFNEETIQHAGRILDELKKRFCRHSAIQIEKKSVHHLLKEGTKPFIDIPENKYDLIYCAGLFDYLSDKVCKQLLIYFFDRLAPGGLLAITNVDACKPFRNMLEFVLDWHLIYRDTKKSGLLVPDQITPDMLKIKRDSTSVNLFIEIRKPKHAL